MDSLKTYKVGLELLIKKENDFIDDTEEFNKTLKWRNATTSRTHGLRMEREQHEGTPENFASS
ncbi:1509_t:CDS:1, partial [Rhizophagus irregularis]